ncbi:MAG: hypothetical protein KOO61_02010 [Spirochaetales bacterium]|nr:hypothetical protein [Spirochaetales bacterium]
MGDESQEPRQKDEEQLSFLQRLIALLFGGDDPERDKRRQLKQIATDLSHQRFKFYKPRSGEALGGLAKFFFEVYRVLGPAQALLQSSEDSNAIKVILIESQHSEQQAAARERFTEEAIRAAARTMLPDQLVAEVKDAVGSYLSGFDSVTVKRINDTYTLIQQLTAFVRFDFYFMLRKFDSSMLEGAYSQTPRLEPINAEYISDDIKDFLEILLSLDFGADWDTALDVLQQYRSVEVISRGAWKKLLGSLSSVARSGILVQMVQHVDENPQYTPTVQAEGFRIVESQLNALKTEVEGFMQKVMRELRGHKVEQAAAAVFGPGQVQRTKHYTEKANAAFAKQMIAGFVHTEAINYLAAFLLDYFRSEARQVVSDLFVVRAKWSDNTISGQLSEAFYATLNLAEEVEQFDQSIGEEGELGVKLRKASAPVKENDAKTARILRQVIRDIDERALYLIKESASNLIVVGRVIKTLIEDYGSKTPEIITNWKELEAQSTEELTSQLTAIYKKIYHFIQLMQMFVKKR